MKTKESPATILKRQILRFNEGRLTDDPSPTKSANFLETGTFTVPIDEAVAKATTYLAEFPTRKARTIRRSIEEIERMKASGEAPHFSLGDVYFLASRGVRNYNNSRYKGAPQKQATREVDALFDPTTGSPTVPESVNFSTPAEGTDDQVDANAAFARFFWGEKGRVYAPQHGAMELRGPNYFVSFNNQPLNSNLETIKGDLEAASDVLMEVNRDAIDSYKLYLPYLGVNDYLKNHSLLMFHALTFEERFLDLRNTMGKGYRDIRERSYSLVRGSVRRFYQTLLGLPYDRPFDSAEVTQVTNDTIDFLRRRGKDQLAAERRSKKNHQGLSYPEVNHPLVLALAGFEAVRQYPETDVIMGIPSGGTELAFLMEMLYELKGRKVDTIQVPFSHRLMDNPQKLQEWLNTKHGLLLTDADVVITEDNSSTGGTLEKIARAIAKYAKSIKPVVAELDGRRLTSLKLPSHFNPDLANTAMRITPVEVVGGGHFLSHGVNSIRQRLDSPPPVPFRKKA